MDRAVTSRPSGHYHKRSRSPHDRSANDNNVKRQRSESPRRYKSHHQHHRNDKPTRATLPFGSSSLHKHDYETYKFFFAEYLDLQKQLNITHLSEEEVKGRWKSFLGKWNRGELAEGWYDPEMKERADQRALEVREHLALAKRKEESTAVPARGSQEQNEDDEDEDEDDEGYGPALPAAGPNTRSGPAMPGFSDLQHRRELDGEDHAARIADLRYERKIDRATQKERLDELVPRADAGTRERQLEKRREATSVNRSFKEAKESGVEEVGESDLLGEDGLDGLKARKKERERQKNEREIRKEEMLRARAAEREERMAEHRKKEEKTMSMLRAIAEQRFGSG